jgi:hypothetical protein
MPAARVIAEAMARLLGESIAGFQQFGRAGGGVANMPTCNPGACAGRDPQSRQNVGGNQSSQSRTMTRLNDRSCYLREVYGALDDAVLRQTHE